MLAWGFFRCGICLDLCRAAIWIFHVKDASLISRTVKRQPAVHVEFIGPARTIRAKNGTVVTNVSIGDSSGNMTAVWFNQSFMQRNIPREPGGYILGFMDKKHGARFVRAVFSETLPGVLPVYPLVRGLTQSVVRNAVRAALDACGTGMMQETLPHSVLSEFNLISLKHAIHSVHFPHDAEELRQARRRLAFGTKAGIMIKEGQNLEGRDGYGSAERRH